MKKYLLIVILLFFSSCNDDVLYDRIGNIICKDKVDCGEEVPESLGTPSDNPLFDTTLNSVRLQYPDSTTDIEYEEFYGVVKPYFYLDNSLLTFQLDKTLKETSIRSELRFGPDTWTIPAEKEHVLSARVKCYGSKKLSKYTFLQIHEYKGANLPLLRLAWERRKEGVTNHIWAGIVTNRDLEDRVYEWIDLGKREDKFFDIRISVRGSKIRVNLNGKLVVDKDISYWYGTQNYYKAGLYLNHLDSKGKTKVQFERLDYTIR